MTPDPLNNTNKSQNFVLSKRCQTCEGADYVIPFT